MELRSSKALMVSRFCTVVGTIELTLNAGTFLVRSAGSLLCALGASYLIENSTKHYKDY